MSKRSKKWAPDLISEPLGCSADRVVDSSKPSAITQDSKCITDICAIFCASSDLEQEMGFLVDHEDEKHKHYLYRANTTIGLEPKSKSLGDLLSGPRQEMYDVSLLRSDRLQIAVTLASSVLQLDGTSWLSSRWTSNDTYFHIKNGGKGSPEIMHPYLPRKICTTSGDKTCSKVAITAKRVIAHSQVLDALGLTLVELCSGKTLPELYKPEDCDGGDAFTKFETACRLLNSVYNEMGTSYDDVVRRCLLQPFDVRSMSLDDEEFQQKVYDDIVTPLVEDLSNSMEDRGLYRFIICNATRTLRQGLTRHV